MISVRVYYEDTDLAGIVYHANYLRFFERARTDYLRDAGIDQTVMGQAGLFFAVRSMDISFIAPGRFDDWLMVETAPVRCSGALALLDQRILREGTVLCAARVTVACLSAQGRAARLPDGVRALFPADGQTAKQIAR